MNTETKTREMLDEVKSCFQELKINFAERNTDQNSPVLVAFLNEGTFFMELEVSCQEREGIMGIRLNFSKTVAEDYRPDLQAVINYVNCHLMDVGHFAVPPENTDIYLFASISLYDRGSKREQIMENLKRVIGQSIEAFKALLQMGTVCPVAVMREFIEETVNERKTEAGESHEPMKMDIEAARKVLGEMQSYFKEAGLPIVVESESMGHEIFTDDLRFRSYMIRGNKLIEIVAVLVPSHKIVKLSMTSQIEMVDSTPELLEIMNLTNFLTWDCYWVKFANQKSIEYRTAYILPAGQIQRDHFTRVLKDFLESGLFQYEYIRRLVENGESILALSQEFLRESVLEGKRKLNHNE